MALTVYRRPPLLAPGDRVRVVAPSGPVNREPFLAGIEIVRSWNLTPLFDDGVFARDGYLAGNDRRRLAEFNAALGDDGAAAVWLARGGYGAARLLPQLSLARVARRPRWLVGFSDASALHALWARAGLQSLHGAVITNLAAWGEAAREQLRRRLFAGLPGELAGTAYSGNGSVCGPLLGGNITVLASLVGSGYLPDFDGAVVFFEDVGELPYRLDRSLTQLRQAGVLDKAAGFAVGQLTHCVDKRGPEYSNGALDAVCGVLQVFGKPILTGLPVGHEDSSWALPFGARVELDPVAGRLYF